MLCSRGLLGVLRGWVGEGRLEGHRSLARDALTHSRDPLPVPALPDSGTLPAESLLFATLLSVYFACNVLGHGYWCLCWTESRRGLDCFL